MAVKSVFLGWQKPCLQLARDFIIEHFTTDERPFAFEHLTIVLPSSRSGRRLLELLVLDAEAAGYVLIPPSFCTLGELADLFLKPSRPLAGTVERELAWITALEAATESERNALPLPADRSPAFIRSLAGALDRLISTLAGGLLTCADVSKTIAAFSDTARWDALDSVHQRYLATLEAWGLADRNQECFTLIEQDSLHFEKTILLIACVDLKPIQLSILERVASEVISCIFCEETFSPGFSGTGNLETKFWQSQFLEIPDEMLTFAETHDDIAREVRSSLVEELSARSLLGLPALSTEQISLGVSDPSLEHFLREAFLEHGMEIRNPSGSPLSKTEPFLLIPPLRSLLLEQSFSSYASLLRHPVVERYLSERVECDGAPALIADAVFSEQVLAAVSIEDLKHSNSSASSQFSKLLHAIDELIKPFQREALRLSDWTPLITTLLSLLYRESDLHRGGLKESLQAFASFLRELHAVERFQEKLSAVEVFDIILAQAEAVVVPPPALRESIEVLGWLELALDDAPLLYVAGLNDEYVPQALNEDPFLPDSLRTRLGLTDNSRRFARDLYTLTSMFHSKERLQLFAGREAPSGERLSLSRLVLQPRSSEALTRRVLNYFEPSEISEKAREFVSKERHRAAYEVPFPEPLSQPITSLSVTAFRDYLACPYRFYLRHVLRLTPLQDAGAELEPRHYGTILHDILKKFSVATQQHHPENLGDVEDLLFSIRDAKALKAFGSKPSPIVRLQLEALTPHLKQFAKEQLALRAEGWRTHDTELLFKGSQLEIPILGDAPMQVVGKVDRIDVHDTLKSWRLIDYKTSGSSKTVEKSHRTKAGWIDLQLPLYLFFAKNQGWQPARACYFTFFDTSEAKLDPASWNDSDLSSAWEKAQEVASNIRQEKFWPPAERFVGFDNFSLLWAGRRNLDEDDEAESEGEEQ